MSASSRATIMKRHKRLGAGGQKLVSARLILGSADGADDPRPAAVRKLPANENAGDDSANENAGDSNSFLDALKAAKQQLLR